MEILPKNIITYGFIDGFAYLETGKSPIQISIWLEKYREEAFIWIKENNIDVETEEGQTAFKLRWS